MSDATQWPEYGLALIAHPCFDDWEVEEQTSTRRAFHRADSRGVPTKDARVLGIHAYWRSYAMTMTWTPGNFTKQMVEVRFMYEIAGHDNRARTIVRLVMEHDQTYVLPTIVEGFMASHADKGAA
jgi:hypothetical protein